MRFDILLEVLFTLSSTAYGCAKDVNDVIAQTPLKKRALASWPPSLTAQESVLVNSFSNTSLAASSYYYTHGLHVAGTNKSMAQWTADRWAENGFTSRLVEYYVYINYPVSHSMSLRYSNGSTFVPSLREAVLAQDPTTSYPNSVPTFHGYSASGSVSAQYVYVGRGQQVDFERLRALNVSLAGKIALARYGGPFRGLKVKNAQQYGMIGCVIFTDPGDDGNITVAKGLAAYPDGPARNPTSVQRGSVQFLSTYPGDPTTPGYPSHEDSPRADKSPVVPGIPSLPISYQDAQPILAALNGYGTPGTAVNRTLWVGALNASYSTGPNPNAILSFSNVMEDKYTPIWDTIGIINGTHQDEVIVIGNHRDAWIVGGAADPNSGSAVMIELAKAFHALQQTGWKPRRTIVLASWDMEEYGLVGSTEFVEEYIPWLSGSVVSYLNVDVACSGPVPDVSASPELSTILQETMKKVVFPNIGSADLYQTQTFYDVWANLSGSIGVLGSGSDYTAFLHKGMGSVDLGAGNGAKDPVYHYHSNYDSYAWMTRFGDPEFAIHKAVGQFLTLLAYHFSTDDIIPFNVTTYAHDLRTYLTSLQGVVNSTNSTSSLDLTPLSTAINTFSTAAEGITNLHQTLLRTPNPNPATITLLNHKYRDFQRGFTSQGGLPGREFYKHVAFAPGVDTGYAPVTFPGVTEAVQAGNLTLAREWVRRTSRGIEVAAGILRV